MIPTNRPRFVCCLLILFAITCANTQNYLERIDTLKTKLAVLGKSERAIDLLNDISYEFRRTSSDSMVPYAEKALEWSTDINYAKGKSIAYKNKGISKFKKGVALETIISDYEKSIEYALEVDDYYTVAACTNNIGLVYHAYNRMQQALTYFFKALDQFSIHGIPNNRLKGLIIGNIGTAYHFLGDHDKELKYLEEVLEYAELNNQPGITAIYTDNYARVMIRSGRAEEAIVKCNEAFVLQKELSDNQSYIQTLSALAEAYLAIDQKEKALEKVQEAIDMAQEFGYDFTIGGSMKVRLEILMAQGKDREAIATGEEGYQFTMKSKSYEDAVIITQNLAKLYEKQGNYEKSLFYIKEFNRFNQETVDQNAALMTAELEAKYQNDMKELEISELNRQNEIKNRLTTFLGIMSLGLLGLAVYCFRLFKIGEEKNKQLIKAESQLETKNEELEKYIESNIQLEQFAHIASHDLKSPLRTVISFTGLLKNKLKDKLDLSELEYFNFIDRGSKQMSHLINDLLSYSKANSLNINLESFDPKELIGEVQENLQFTIDKTNASIEFQNIPDVIKADRIKLKQVFQNVVSNGIKFVPAERSPLIQIACEESDHCWSFSISDNGIGIKDEFKSKIFQPYERLNRSDEFEGTGLGLAICKKLIEQHKGNIEVKSQEGSGTTITFSIGKNL